MKRLQLLGVGICAAGLIGLAYPVRASIVTTFDNTIAPIVGTGNSSGGWTSANNPDLGLTLSLRAQDRYTGSGDQTPNDGAGTFTFPAGQQWDVWFDVNSGSSALSTYTYSLIFNSSLDAPGVNQTIPVAQIPDNGTSTLSGNEFQNAEWLGFAFMGGYDMSLQATYYFTLNATDSTENVVDSVDMTVVNNGVAPVPEASTVFAGMLLLLPLGASGLRILRKNRMA